MEAFFVKKEQVMTQLSNRSIWSVALVVVMAIAWAPNVQAKNDWHLLGQRVVNDRAELDTIQVGVDKGRFTRLRLSVADAPVEVKRVVIHFGDGSTQKVERNLFVGEDKRSPVLELQGKRRIVTRVVFHYEARSRGWEKATVKLYGQ
jgi:hypothetical protein